MTIEFFTLRRVKSQQLCQKELSSLLRKNLRSWIFSNTAIIAFRCLSWRRARPSTRRRSSSRSADACSPTPEWRISGAWPSSAIPTKPSGLRERYEGVEAAWHGNKRHWNDLYVDRDLSDAFVREQIRRSYMLVLRHNVTPRTLRDEMLAHVARHGLPE